MTESTGTPPDSLANDDRLLHQFNNYLSVIIGFCDVLLGELSENDPRRPDIVEIHRAAHAAVALLPQLSARMR